MDESFGPYQLIRRLAAGGMAEVFLATHEGPRGFRKHVAIKRILPHLAEDDAFVSMFLDEVRLVARFNHPNIVQVFELGEHDGRYFAAMEYVAGASLAHVLKTCRSEKRRLPAELVAKVVADASSALAYAHSFADADGVPLNLVHRDVNPQNLMWSYDGVIKVLDFGVAKAATNLHRTTTSSLKGKLAYMSPEQVRQNAMLDSRSDLFSLGVVLFEALLHRRPFRGNSEIELLTSIANDPVPDARTLDPALSPTLCAIVMRALEKERERRYPSAREMQVDLEDFLAQQKNRTDSYALGQYLRDLLRPDRYTAGDSEPGRAGSFVSNPEPATERLTPDLLGKASALDIVVVSGQEASVAPRRKRWPIVGALAVALAAATAAALILSGRSSPPTVAVTANTAVAMENRQPDAFFVGDATGAPGPDASETEVTHSFSDRSSARTRSVDGRGRLQVDTRPWTDVSVDGKKIGRTPLSEPVSLKAGDHKVTIENREQGIVFHTRVQIKSGETEWIKEKFEEGSIEVLVHPYGDVFVDGKRRGMTPLEQPIELYEGTHTVRVYCDLTGKSETRRVKITAGGAQRLKFDLR